MCTLRTTDSVTNKYYLVKLTERRGRCLEVAGHISPANFANQWAAPISRTRPFISWRLQSSLFTVKTRTERDATARNRGSCTRPKLDDPSNSIPVRADIASVGPVPTYLGTYLGRANQRFRRMRFRASSRAGLRFLRHSGPLRLHPHLGQLSVMRIIFERPPNFAEILAAFPRASQPTVIFCYGDAIYNPSRCTISEALIAHETAHSIRHGLDPEGWWRRYIADPRFRLNEEVIAHAAEYMVACRGKARPGRRVDLRAIAEKLADPLYGFHLTKERAAKLIVDTSRGV